jgi:hypothetical protein
MFGDMVDTFHGIERQHGVALCHGFEFVRFARQPHPNIRELCRGFSMSFDRVQMDQAL